MEINCTSNLFAIASCSDITVSTFFGAVKKTAIRVAQKVSGNVFITVLLPYHSFSGNDTFEKWHVQYWFGIDSCQPAYSRFCRMNWFLFE